MITAMSDDLFTREVTNDPYTYFGHLREEDLVHWNELYELWVITRHDDLVWLTRHHELFSSEVLKRDPRPPYPQVDAADLGLYEYVRDFSSDQFIQHDRPAHLEMPKVIHGYFTPRSMEAWRPMVQSAITDLLDAAEGPSIRELAKKLLAGGQGAPDRLRTQTEGMQGMLEYLSPLVEERLEHPGDDFVSVVASGEKRGIFTRHQVLVNCSLLLLAGHETTINLLCNGTLAFIHHPAQWVLFKQDPAGWAKRATEECLRYDPPVKSIQRIAAQDVELRGKVLHKDDRLRWFIASANRDPEVFAHPETFDITRDPNPHVAFGSGVHHCLGATLARLEGQEAFKALAERFPSLHVETEELAYQPSMTFRSLTSLPVAW